MTTNPHSANQVAGSKWDNKLRTDVTGSTSSAIGHHFPPMVHNAPIHGLSTLHDTIACPECSANILWNGNAVTFTCQGCGALIDGAMLTA